ncbi:308_t:CDS:2 [Ambispora leptoticha]|uniref:308_t:CDS:1 n=1 Tax=Ambispora leptoticha TaxID=144679 RepID=A0A9N8VFN2_9GLOM|nr:308_t:CDS:2 [Ambispora leptoticha]
MHYYPSKSGKRVRYDNQNPESTDSQSTESTNASAQNSDIKSQYSRAPEKNDFEVKLDVKFYSEDAFYGMVQLKDKHLDI